MDRLAASVSLLGSVRTADERGYSTSHALRSRDGSADTSSMRVLSAVLVGTPGDRREGIADFPYMLKAAFGRAGCARARFARPCSPANTTTTEPGSVQLRAATIDDHELA